jgi:hypothetical protein
VKSKKVTIVEDTQSPSFRSWWLGKGYVPAHWSATRVIRKYEPEDQEVISLLEKLGQTYKIVDLCGCSFPVWLRAKKKGIKETPTMILNQNKISGIENIKQALQRIANLNQPFLPKA